MVSTGRSIVYGFSEQQKCWLDNRTVLEKEALEKWNQIQEEMKANRSRAREVASQRDIEDTSALDKILDKLHNSDSAGRRTRCA